MSTELEQRLRADMERFTESATVPAGLAARAYPRGRRRQRKARALIAAATAGGLAVAAVTAAGVAGAFRPAGGQPIEATAYVISHARRALSPASLDNLISYTRDDFARYGMTWTPSPGGLTGYGTSRRGLPPGRETAMERFAYRGTAKFILLGASGRPLFSELLVTRGGKTTTTVVTYSGRTWWTTTRPEPPPLTKGSPACGSRGPANPGPGAWPEYIRAQLSCGRFTVAGTERVDGVSTLKIREGDHGMTLWLDPRTYLPVRVSAGYSQIDYQWRPATAGNLALLELPIPAGFTRVAAPAETISPPRH